MMSCPTIFIQVRDNINIALKTPTKPNVVGEYNILGNKVIVAPDVDAIDEVDC